MSMVQTFEPQTRIRYMRVDSEIKRRELLNSLADKLKLSQEIKLQASEILEKTYPHFNKGGYSCECLCAACLYYAVKQKCMPYTLRSFEAISHYNRKYIGRYHRKIIRCLDEYKLYTPKTCTMRPTVFVKDYLNKLHAGQKMRRAAFHIDRELLKRGICSGTTRGTAAGIVYLAGFITDGFITEKPNIQGSTESTLRNVAYAVDMTENTVRKRWHSLVKDLGEEYLSQLMKKLAVEPSTMEYVRKEFARHYTLHVFDMGENSK